MTQNSRRVFFLQEGFIVLHSLPMSLQTGVTVTAAIGVLLIARSIRVVSDQEKPGLWNLDQFDLTGKRELQM